MANAYAPAQPFDPTRLVDPYLASLAAGGAVVLATALWALPTATGSMDAPRWLLLAGLVAASWLILNRLILFDWRGQRIALGPDEVLVFLALLALPLPFVVLFAIVPMTAYQVKTRRPLLRAAANVAVLALAGGACVSTYLFLQLVAPPLVAICGALVAYTFVTHVLVSSVFSLRERVAVHVVFGERFWIPTLLHVALGIAGGLATWALWNVHPVAVAALVPFAYLAREHVGLVARTEREALVHDRLSGMTRALVGEKDFERAATRILQTCGDVFQAGRTTLVVEQDGRERRWSLDFEGGASSEPPMAATLEGPGGAKMGALLIHPNRRSNARFAPVDRNLLAIVAAEASATLANARALHELDEARERLVSSRVARPLVRRIVRALMDETHADASALLRLGESLARTAEAQDLDAFSRAYAEMGLGRIETTSADAGRYEFTGSDLFEKSPGSRATTCYLALGYATGAASRLHGDAPARGAEVSCESRGDAKCRFVVHVK
ncbi:MAG: hypothetical protein QOE90_3131 [Thermoplasmata archaeon]|jgi:predicted hydrocarbon binding protein|nr:hypothetical protein [Thermoplasmata archaeon]